MPNSAERVYSGCATGGTSTDLNNCVMMYRVDFVPFIIRPSAICIGLSASSIDIIVILGSIATVHGEH